MTLQEKVEKIKLFLEGINFDTLDTSNTSEISTSNVISKPNKQYISSSDILKLFKITKSEYNNILVRIDNH
jgi:hypothetical protein